MKFLLKTYEQKINCNLGPILSVQPGSFGSSPVISTNTVCFRKKEIFHTTKRFRSSEKNKNVIEAIYTEVTSDVLENPESSSTAQAEPDFREFVESLYVWEDIMPKGPEEDDFCVPSSVENLVQFVLYEEEDLKEEIANTFIEQLPPAACSRPRRPRPPVRAVDPLTEVDRKSWCKNEKNFILQKKLIRAKKAKSWKKRNKRYWFRPKSVYLREDRGFNKWWSLVKASNPQRRTKPKAVIYNPGFSLLPKQPIKTIHNYKHSKPSKKFSADQLEYMRNQNKIKNAANATALVEKNEEDIEDVEISVIYQESFTNKIDLVLDHRESLYVDEPFEEWLYRNPPSPEAEIFMSELQERSPESPATALTFEAEDLEADTVSDLTENEICIYEPSTTNDRVSYPQTAERDLTALKERTIVLDDSLKKKEPEPRTPQQIDCLIEKANEHQEISILREQRQDTAEQKKWKARSRFQKYIPVSKRKVRQKTIRFNVLPAFSKKKKGVTLKKKKTAASKKHKAYVIKSIKSNNETATKLAFKKDREARSKALEIKKIPPSIFIKGSTTLSKGSFPTHPQKRTRSTFSGKHGPEDNDAKTREIFQKSQEKSKKTRELFQALPSSDKAVDKQPQTSTESKNPIFLRVLTFQDTQVVSAAGEVSIKRSCTQVIVFKNYAGFKKYKYQKHSPKCRDNCEVVRHRFTCSVNIAPFINRLHQTDTNGALYVPKVYLKDVEFTRCFRSGNFQKKEIEDQLALKGVTHCQLWYRGPDGVFLADYQYPLFEVNDGNNIVKWLEEGVKKYKVEKYVVIGNKGKIKLNLTVGERVIFVRNSWRQRLAGMWLKVLPHRQHIGQNFYSWISFFECFGRKNKKKEDRSGPQAIAKTLQPGQVPTRSAKKSSQAQNLNKPKGPGFGPGTRHFSSYTRSPQTNRKPSGKPENKKDPTAFTICGGAAYGLEKSGDPFREPIQKNSAGAPTELRVYHSGSVSKDALRVYHAEKKKFVWSNTTTKYFLQVIKSNRSSNSKKRIAYRGPKFQKFYNESVIHMIKTYNRDNFGANLKVPECPEDIEDEVATLPQSRTETTNSNNKSLAVLSPNSNTANILPSSNALMLSNVHTTNNVTLTPDQTLEVPLTEEQEDAIEELKINQAWYVIHDKVYQRSMFFAEGTPGYRTSANGRPVYRLTCYSLFYELTKKYPYGTTWRNIPFSCPVLQNKRGKNIWRKYNIARLITRNHSVFTSREGAEILVSRRKRSILLCNYYPRVVRPKNFRGDSVNFRRTRKTKLRVPTHYTRAFDRTETEHLLTIEPPKTARLKKTFSGLLSFIDRRTLHRLIHSIICQNAGRLEEYTELERERDLDFVSEEAGSSDVETLINWGIKKVQENRQATIQSQIPNWKKIDFEEKVIYSLPERKRFAVNQEDEEFNEKFPRYPQLKLPRDPVVTPRDLVSERYRDRDHAWSILAVLTKVHREASKSVKCNKVYHQLLRRKFFSEGLTVRKARVTKKKIKKLKKHAVRHGKKLLKKRPRKSFVLWVPFQKWMKKIQPRWKRKSFPRFFRLINKVGIHSVHPTSPVWFSFPTQEADLKHASWEEEQNARKAQPVNLARMSLRSKGHGLLRGFEERYDFQKKTFARRQIKKKLPYYAPHYALKNRKWHTPRDLGGSPQRRPELPVLEVVRRDALKEYRYHKKNGYRRDSWAAKTPTLRRFFLGKARAKDLRPPKFPDPAWRELERQTGYPATLGYAHSRPTWRNTFVTDRWWIAKSTPLSVYHPFALLKPSSQPESFTQDPRRPWYDTSVEFYNTTLQTQRTAGLRGAAPGQVPAQGKIESQAEFQEVIGGTTQNFNELSPIWQAYLQNVDDHHRSPTFLGKAFNFFDDRLFSFQVFEQNIYNISPDTWKQLRQSLNSAELRGELNITSPEQLRMLYINARRDKHFVTIPNWWVNEAKVRVLALKKTVHEISKERRVFATKNGRGLACSYEDREFNKNAQDETPFSGKSITSAWKVMGGQPALLVSLVSQKAFLERFQLRYLEMQQETLNLQKQNEDAARKIKEHLRVEEYKPFAIVPVAFDAVEDIFAIVRGVLAALITKKLSLLAPANLFADLEEKEIGTPYQIWTERQKVSQKKASLLYSSYEQDDEKHKTIYNLPFSHPIFPATGNRNFSYSRTLRVYYRKTRVPRFSRINVFNCKTIRPLLDDNKKTRDERFGTSSTLHLKNQRARSDTGFYLPKRWRILSRNRIARKNSNTSDHLDTLTTGQHRQKTKRRFARSSSSLKYFEDKRQDLRRRTPLAQPHKVYAISVRAAGLSMRPKTRAIFDWKIALRYRRLSTEQALPTWLQRRKDKKYVDWKRAKSRHWNLHWTTRIQVNTWNWDDSRIGGSLRTRRPYAKFVVTSAGEKVSLPTQIVRAPWVKGAYKTWTRKRINYLQTLVSKTKLQVSKRRSQVVHFEKPNDRNRLFRRIKNWEKRILFPRNSWSRKKIKRSERYEKWRTNSTKPGRFYRTYAKKYREHNFKKYILKRGMTFAGPEALNQEAARDWVHESNSKFETKERTLALEHKDNEKRSKVPPLVRFESNDLSIENLDMEEKLFYINIKKRLRPNSNSLSKLTKKLAVSRKHRINNATSAAAKVLRNELAEQKTTSQLLKNSTRLSPFVPRTFETKIPCIPTSDEEIELKKKEQRYLDFFTYQHTAEVAETTTNFFPLLRSLLRKRHFYRKNRFEEDAKVLVQKVYWSLRFYLCQDELGSRLYAKDHSKEQRFEASEGVAEKTETRYFKEKDRKFTRERRQPHWLTTKENQDKAPLGFLRIWFPRFHKFYLEDKHRFEELTFSIIDSQRVSPSPKAWKDWETHKLVSHDGLAFDRRLDTESTNDRSWYEGRLKTTRRQETVLAGFAPTKNLPYYMIYKMPLRKNFFKKTYTTLATTSQGALNLSVLVERFNLRGRQQSGFYDIYSFVEARRQHTQAKAGTLARGRLSFVPQSGDILTGCIDFRFSRAKSPRNAQYLKRSNNTEFNLYNRYRITLENRETALSLLPPAEQLKSIGSRRIPFYISKPLDETSELSRDVQPPVTCRRTPSSMRSRYKSKFRKPAKRLFVKRKRKRAKLNDWMVIEVPKAKNLLLQKTFDNAELNFERKSDAKHVGYDFCVSGSRSILQFHSAAQRTFVTYQKRSLIVARGQRILLKNIISKTSGRERFFVQTWYRAQEDRILYGRFNIKKGKRQIYPLVWKAKYLKKLRVWREKKRRAQSVVFLKELAETKYLPVVLGLTLPTNTISLENKLQFFVKNAVSVTPYVEEIDKTFALHTQSKKLSLRQSFTLTTSENKGLQGDRSLFFNTYIEARERNILVERRAEFWELLTGERFLDLRTLKNWSKDRKRFLIRSSWAEIPEVVFKDMRARIRLYEWKESDQHFHRLGWKNAFKLLPSERQLAPWLEPLRRRRTAYSTKHGEYRRYSFPREQKRQKERQYYRKARASNEDRRIYVHGRRWPRLRTTAYRLARSLFEFRNTRTAQKHFSKNLRMSPITTGYSRHLVGLRNRLDVCLIFLGFFKTVFWARRFASYGIVKVNTKKVYKANYRFQPGDLIEFDWEKIVRRRQIFEVEETWHTRENLRVNFKLQTRPGNFKWHPNHRFLYYVRFPYPEDIEDNVRLCRWRFDSFRRDAGIGRS